MNLFICNRRLSTLSITNSSAPNVSFACRNFTAIWEADSPNFSECFVRTVLVWLPCLIFWLIVPVDLLSIFQKRGCPRNLLNALDVLKVATISLLCSLTLVEIVSNLIWQYYFGQILPLSHKVSPAVLFLTCIGMLVISVIRTFFVEFSPFSVSSFICAFALFGIFELRLVITSFVYVDEIETFDEFHGILFILFYSVVIVGSVLYCFVPLPQKTALPLSGELRPSPEPLCSWLNRFTFWWVGSLIWKGHRKAISKSDIWFLNEQEKSDSVVPPFQDNLRKEFNSFLHQKQRNKSSLLKSENLCNHDGPPATLEPLVGFASNKSQHNVCPENPSLVSVIVKTFWPIIIGSGALRFLTDGLTFLNPQILSLLISFTSNREPAWHGYFYIVLLCAVGLSQSLAAEHYIYAMGRLGLRIRCAVLSSVYSKSLKLSNGARRERTVGEIVNLMSVDASRFQDSVIYLHLLWSAPLQIFVALYFLYQTLGISIFSGVALLALMFPLNVIVNYFNERLETRQMHAKDRRLKLLSEIFSGIKIIKLYAWEPAFEREINSIRMGEVNLIKKGAMLGALLEFGYSCTPLLGTLATFATYVLIDSKHVLSPEKAFVALSLFGIIQIPVSYLPWVVTDVLQLKVSAKRLSDFFASEELPEKVVEHGIKTECAAAMSNATMSWHLEDVDSHNHQVLVNGKANSEQHHIGDPPKGISPPELSLSLLDSHATVPPESMQTNGDTCRDVYDAVSLKDISLRVRRGQLVAVVGKIGSGKSSLISALCGEMEKISGTIIVNGSIAYCPQQAWIQNLTLRENVVFSKPFDMDKYQKVVTACALKPDFDLLPAGDLTEIGERGINLSGGQKQRISLARAVYQDCELYLFDDPLSAVDVHVASQIFHEVIGPKSILKNKTRLLITHSLSFLPRCDLIVVLANGHIIEAGGYYELARNGGAFADFLEACLLEAPGQELAEIDEDTLDALSLSFNARSLLELRLSESRSKSEALPNVGSPPTRRTIQSSIRRVSSLESLHANYGRCKTDSVSTSRLALNISEKQPSFHSVKQLSIEQVELSDHEVEKSGKLTGAESYSVDKVSWKVYLTYFRAAGWGRVLHFLLAVISQLCVVGSSIWLSYWSDNQLAVSLNTTNVTVSAQTALGVYGALAVFKTLLVFLGSGCAVVSMVKASKTIHSRLLKAILRAPMWFFETTPSGRIINLCGRDVQTVDSKIPVSLEQAIFSLCSLLGSVFAVVYVAPLFAVALIPISVIYYLIQRLYVTTSRQLRRIESVTRSPIYSHFQESLVGVSSIRAYNQQQRFIRESLRLVDANNSAEFNVWIANRWLGLRLDFVANLLVAFAALFAILGRNSESISAGLVGLAITYAFTIMSELSYFVKQMGQLETEVVAMERIEEYAHTDSEAPWKKPDVTVPADWPSQGAIDIVNYSTRYRPGLDLVLKDISCSIRPGEKIGVVGRTGAGKSSLTLSLFRLIEPIAGEIIIDGFNISKIGLHDLRSSLTIIPQDPVLFSGSLRFNLDPFSQHLDSELWHALELSHLKDFVLSLPNQLLYDVSEGGSNLSVGQRQLICLARALLRRSKLLILDEATAAVDVETDAHVQATIRQQFRSHTMITIAHRLNTILDCGRIMVLEQGRICEFASPAQLAQDENGHFCRMLQEAGLKSQ